MDGWVVGWKDGQKGGCLNEWINKYGLIKNSRLGLCQSAIRTDEENIDRDKNLNTPPVTINELFAYVPEEAVGLCFCREAADRIRASRDVCVPQGQ